MAPYRLLIGWVAEAFEQFEGVGYVLSSAYTACRDADVRFLYRDALWNDGLPIGLRTVLGIAQVA